MLDCFQTEKKKLSTRVRARRGRISKYPKIYQHKSKQQQPKRRRKYSKKQEQIETRQRQTGRVEHSFVNTFKIKLKPCLSNNVTFVLASFPAMLISTQCCRMLRSMMLKGQMTLSDYPLRPSNLHTHTQISLDLDPVCPHF